MGTLTRADGRIILTENAGRTAARLSELRQTMETAKHPSEMADDILWSLGFIKKENPYSDGEAWTHQMGAGKFYFHILTPKAVAEALIEIGQNEFRRMAIASLASL